MGLAEAGRQAEQPPVLAQAARLGVAELHGLDAELIVGDQRQLLEKQQHQALHLLPQVADAQVVEVEDQPYPVALFMHLCGEATGENVLETQEALQRLAQVAAGHLQVADHIEQTRPHRLAQVQADVGIAGDVVEGRPE